MDTSLFQCVWKNMWRIRGYISFRCTSSSLTDTLCPTKEINCATRRVPTCNPTQCWKEQKSQATFGVNTLKPLLSRSRLLTALVSCQLIPVRTYKMKHHLKRRCKDCYFLTVDDQLLVHCKTHPRHKQKQIVSPEWKKWIITHATQSKRRPW